MFELIGIVIALAFAAEERPPMPKVTPSGLGFTPVCVANTVQAANRMGEWIALQTDTLGNTRGVACSDLQSYGYLLRPAGNPQTIQGKVLVPAFNGRTWTLTVPKK